MSFVTCIVPVSPLRKEPSHRSEMVSQLLFGEKAELLEKEKDFIRVRCCFDEYEGWCQLNQMVTDPHILINQQPLLSAEWSNRVDCNGSPMQISLGSPLAWFEEEEADIGPYRLRYTGLSWNPSTAAFRPENIRQIAFAYLNTPYLWGGRSVFGIDCSGFTQQVFRFFNKSLPRDAYQQAALGEVVDFLLGAVCGDLAFFDNEIGSITHVGILLGNDSIIHASGQVRIDPIDGMHIIHKETGVRTHQLRIIKRI